MTSRLDLVHVKLERAEEHISDLSDAIAAFFRTNPYELATKTDPQIGELVYYAARIEPVPLRLAAITGDVLQNLRSALDHLAYQLVLAGGGVPSRQTYFPIAEDAAKYAATAPVKLRGMVKAAIDAIDAIKPYKGGNDALWHLHELNNIDKHRLVMTVGSTNVAHGITPAMFQRIQASWRGSRPSDPFPYSEASNLFESSKARHFPLEVGDDLLRMAPGTEVDKNMKFHFDIAFGESQVVAGEPLLDTVESLAKAVSDTITRLAGFL